MDCKTAEELILSNGSADGLKEHLDSCANCRSMGDAWNSMKDVRPVAAEPSRTLDFMIKGAAAAQIAHKRHHRRVLARRFIIYAAAASCVLITWFAVYNVESETKVENYGGIWNNLDMDREILTLSADLEYAIQNMRSGQSTSETYKEPELDLDILDFST
ncbi:MAG TPA: hypothetical protein DCZ94_01515 [Lentisphaeria bacterium]|nr:MAG: hypothetical protein A2X48_21400 [Lentisphaerae bacterium GWF2_49_21]HBC85609.1 hypothetical protein [Lentisphaeria bacterium]